MTYPFKSINDEEHPVPNNGSDESFMSTRGTSDVVESLTVVAAPGSKKRFMLIDETQLPPEEAERLLVKRAYNRECAERARKRSKDNVRELHRQIAELQEDKNELRRSLASSEKEVKQLQADLSLIQSTNAANDTFPRLLYNNNNRAGGLSTEAAAALNLYSQSSHSPLSLFHLANGGVNQKSGPSSASSLPPIQSWELNRLFLQQLRKK